MRKIDKKTAVSFGSKGIETALSIGGILTGNIPLQVTALVPSIAETLLCGLGILDEKIDKELQKQLDEVIKQTLKECEKELKNDYIGKVLVLLRPYVENSDYQEVNYSNMMKWLKENVEEEAKREGLHITFSELRYVLQFFLEKFKFNVLKYNELCNYLKFKELDIYINRLEELDKKIDNINKKMEELDEEYEGYFTKISDIACDCDYIGRKNEEYIIEEALQSNRFILLSGVGGIGKTEVLKHVCSTWINKLKSNKNLCIGYMQYNQSMDDTVYQSVKFDKRNNYKEDVEIAWKCLTQIACRKQCVLFIDNVDQTVEMDKSIEKLYSFPGKVIMTSRLHNFPKFKEIPIGELDEEECVDLFAKKFEGDITSPKIVEEVVIHKAAKHTLTIYLLACIANDNLWSLEELEAKLIEKSFNLSYCGVNNDYLVLQEEYKKLFDLSNLCEREKKVLIAFSRFPYEFLDVKILLELLGACAQINSVLFFRILYYKGWLEKNNLGYRMHPIIAKSICSYTELEIKEYESLFESIDTLLFENMNKGILQWSSVIDIADSICINVKKEKNDKLFGMTASLLQMHAYSHRIEMAAKLYKYMETFGDTKNEQCIGRLLFSKTVLNLRNEEYFEAIENGKKALKYMPDNFELQLTMAQLYFAVGKYKKAIKLYQDIISTHTQLNASNSLWAVKAKLAESLMADERENEALFLAKTIKEDLEKECNNSLEIAHIYDALANVYIQAKLRAFFLQEALKMKNKAKELYSELCGEDSLDVALSYKTIGTIYSYLQQYDKAEEQYLEAEKIYIRNVGEQYLRLGELYYEFGILYINLSKYKEAIKYLQKALSICEKYYTLDGEIIKKIYYELGLANAKMGNEMIAVNFIRLSGHEANLDKSGRFIEIR